MSQSRPKIEIMRLPSSEQAKMRPLLEGGVQLEAEFKHIRYGDYASYSSLEWGRDCYRTDSLSRLHDASRVCHTAPPLATKSCDNIFARQVVCERERRGPFLWREATRSEEMLCCSSQGHRQPIGLGSSTRSRLTALLKKLSPRPRRPPPSQPAPCPWVLVEFSARDLEPGGREGSRDSTTSDKSFDMAVREAVQRREKATKQKTATCTRTTVTATTTTAKPLVAPTILIGTPKTSPHTSSSSSTPVERHISSTKSPQQEHGAGRHRSRYIRGVRAPARPHTLLIQPPTPPSGSLTPQPLACKMASFESIGSCSLDAYATASEASELAGGKDDRASEQTLRSEPLSVPSPPAKSSGGASTPEYVKRTARLFETPSSSAKTSPNKPSLVVPPTIALTNGTSSEGLSNGSLVVGKKPSYLGLACSISGYSGITTYDSKLREGFRSRDHSPGRLGLVRSRDVSPLRPDGGPESLPACFKSECGNYLVAPNKSRSVEKSISLSGSPIRVPDPDRIQVHMNGGDVSDRLKNIKSAAVLTNGTMDETDRVSAPMVNGVGADLGRNDLPQTSLIRESSRNFMSSMLNTSPLQNESSTTVKSTPCPSMSQEAISVAVKSDSKDSLSPPVAASPMKRSPGAVRVVEFTSQPKSYVRTVVSSKSLFMTSSGESAPEQVQSSGGNYPVTSSVSDTVVTGSTHNGNTSKSFIQQRVERLYGPGALAQGFFRRMKQSSRSQDDHIMIVDSVPITEVSEVCTSSHSLPVLRHLRPEFRAQLSLSTARRPPAEGRQQPATSDLEAASLKTQVSVESAAESLPDLQPAAPEVILPPEQTHTKSTESVDQPAEKDGHYFLKVLKKELDRLNGLVVDAEALLSSSESLPEDALGKLRSASGQARLLVRQKLQQFEGLCHKNISQSADEPFPTTSLDLQGFWDMVYLQVDQVHRLFEEIERLKKANWVEEHMEKADVPDGGVATVPKRRPGYVKRSAAKSAASEETRRANEEARKAREEARRKMMEERRRAMREKKGNTESVEIFMPLENGK